MGSKLITKGVWDALTKAARRSKKPAHVAVAYFGKGAARLLPLPAGSHLVADASEAAVKSGQTHPRDLERIRRRKVTVYSAWKLHAKVFAYDTGTFIGSANASKNSKSILQEAVVFTTDSGIGRTARGFVKSLCLEPLGPEALKRLQKLYRPPRFVAGYPGKKSRQRTATFSELRLAQISNVSRIPESLYAALDVGQKQAEERRQRGRGHYIETFYWPGAPTFRKGELVILVHKYPSGRRIVSPPGHIIHLRQWRSGKRRATVVSVELSDREWMSFSRVTRSLGTRAGKSLKRDGRVRDETLAKRLLALWHEKGVLA